MLDAAADSDAIGRSSVAAALAGQLIELGKAGRGSFAVHISGAWGSGKSSLVNFMLADLSRAAPTWLVPSREATFDAWRESQVGPAWWSLLNDLRSRVLASRRTRRDRAAFRLRELWRRLRIAGLIAPAGLTALLLVAVVSYVIWRADPNQQLDASDSVVGLATAAVALPSTAGAVVFAFSRWLTWRTPAGARLFQRRDDNPMGDVIEHARWLRRQVAGPVVIVVDDLDRCRAEFVIELLEAIQTLLRPLGANGAGAGPLHPLVVIALADDRWLHAAFEHHYSEFSDALTEPGRTLGHLFLAKLFQVHVEIPELAATEATGLLRAKTGIALSAAPSSVAASRGDVAAAARTFEQQLDAADTIDEKVSITAGEARQRTADHGAAGDAVRDAWIALGRSVAAPDPEAVSHELEPYLPLLDPNPRSIIRFANTYAFARLSLTRGPAVSTDALARWTIVRLRWPLLARRLTASPDLIDRWHATGPGTDDPHLSLVRSPAFTAVVCDGTNPRIRAADIRACTSASTSEVAADTDGTTQPA